MKKTMKIMSAVLALEVVALCAIAGMETKYAAGTTSAAVTFGPTRGQMVVKSINATSDKLNSAVTLYARPSSLSKYAPTATPSLSATHIKITNTGYALTTNNSCVYVHANGTCDYRTISTATLTNVTLSSGITVAGAAGDYLYEVTAQGAAVVGYYGTGTGTNDALNLSGDLFAVPGDSPLYVVLDGSGTAKLMVTVDKD